jgi:outer membrane protein
MVVATLAAVPFAAQAGWDWGLGEQKGDILVRAGLSQINPEADNAKPVGGDFGIPVSTLVIDSDVTPTFDVTWMFSNHFGIELLAAYPATHGIDLKPYSGGKVRLGYVDVLPPTLSLVWRPFDETRSLQPYVGIGANWTLFSSEKLRGDTLAGTDLPSNTKLRLDDSFGGAGVVGLDFFPGEKKKWFANVNIRYIGITTDAALHVPGVGTEQAGEIDINPMVYTVNVGYRFSEAAPPPERKGTENQEKEKIQKRKKRS